MDSAEKCLPNQEVSGARDFEDGDPLQAVAKRLPESEVRIQLAARLNALIEERRLTQTVAATIFGIPQPHVSELRHFKLHRFSSERLLRFITLLDRDVEILIRPKDENHARGIVSVQIAALKLGQA